jgi:hypothetical protein
MEAVTGVEGRGLVVDDVDDHQPSGSSPAGGNRLTEGFGKRERAVTLALVKAVDGETTLGPRWRWRPPWAGTGPRT